MFKKLLVVSLVACMAFFGTNAMADQGDPGWYYQKNHPEMTQEFKNGVDGNGWIWMEKQPDEQGGCGGQPCDPQAGVEAVLGTWDDNVFTPGLFGEAHKLRNSDFTSWDFWGNGGGDDTASASADGWGGFDAEGYAHATGSSKEYVGGHRGWIFNPENWNEVPNPADVEGEASARGKAKTFAFALDLGLTSTSIAFATAGGKAFVDVEAFGVNGCYEFANATLYLGGSVYQENNSKEIGYGNQGVSGGSWSEANGSASKEYSDFGNSYDVLGIFTFGGAEINGHIKNYDFVKTQGSTLVTIDPYGSNRSFYGITQSSSSINPGSLTLDKSYVAGGGGVGGMVNNGGSYVGGVATYSFNGTTQGSGNAQINGQLSPGSVFVSGSAHAVAE